MQPSLPSGARPSSIRGQAASPMPNRELGLYRATLAAIAYDAEFRTLTGESGQQLLLSVLRDPLEAISEGLVALGVHPGQEEQKLAELVARLPGWAGHIRSRNENADPKIAAGSPASMADLLALWLLVERGRAVSAPARANGGSDAAALIGSSFRVDRCVPGSPGQARSCPVGSRCGDG